MHVCTFATGSRITKTLQICIWIDLYRPSKAVETSRVVFAYLKFKKYNFVRTILFKITFRNVN